MTAVRSTFTLDDALAEQARALGVNISAAARDGVGSAVRASLAEADRHAYLAKPETVDTFWADAEAWGDECTGATSGWRTLVERAAPSWS